MSLSYSAQSAQYILGTVGTPLTLTTSYSDNMAVINTSHFSEMAVFVDYTPGAGGGGNSIQIRIEGSGDDHQLPSPSWNQETFSTIAGGLMTHTVGEHSLVGAVASVTVKWFFLSPPAFLQARLSVKETLVGGVAGTVKIRTVLGGV